jgi:Leucine-rich repeat (LRR) protein
MFIKRDHRRVLDILDDDNDPKVVLNLSRRHNEFQGDCRVIFNDSTANRLRKVETLNLYNNLLIDLKGIECLTKPDSIADVIEEQAVDWALEELNLGCNKLSSLPLEVISICSVQC